MSDAPDEDDIAIVDAHQHFWDLGRNYYPWLCDREPIPFRYGDYSALRRNYLPPDYRADVGRHRVVRTVHIEAEWDRAAPVAETRWLEGVHAAHGLPTAVVGHAALHEPGVGEVLAAHAQSALVRGIRHKPHAAPSATEAKRGAPQSMDDPRWRDGYALLARHKFSFDLQTPWWHLDAAAELARDFPATQIVINHTGLPADRSAEGLAAWRRAMAAAADQPNVAVKISGLGRQGLPWTLEANAPIIRDTLAIFGIDRCLFASNFPVDSLVASFDAIATGMKAAVADREPADRHKLFYANAARIYRLES
ncbi:MAG TPA: amidohydrolase family protein [Beijerinckiaceae bacterium]|jgi:predicted TIM-barrel fold metal-dependent hydrolase